MTTRHPKRSLGASWWLLSAVLATSACTIKEVRQGDESKEDVSGDASADGQSTISGNAGGASHAGGGSGEGGAAAQPTECAWPDGPFGVQEGQTLPNYFTWQGYAPGATDPSTISIQDFFDCDGTRGIDAVVIDTSQYG